MNSKSSPLVRIALIVAWALAAAGVEGVDGEQLSGESYSYEAVPCGYSFAKALSMKPSSWEPTFNVGRVDDQADAGPGGDCHEFVTRTLKLSTNTLDIPVTIARYDTFDTPSEAILWVLRADVIASDQIKGTLQIESCALNDGNSCYFDHTLIDAYLQADGAYPPFTDAQKRTAAQTILPFLYPSPAAPPSRPPSSPPPSPPPLAHHPSLWLILALIAGGGAAAGAVAYCSYERCSVSVAVE